MEDKQDKITIIFGKELQIIGSGDVGAEKIFLASSYLNRLANSLLDAEYMRRMEAQEMASRLNLKGN